MRDLIAIVIAVGAIAILGEASRGLLAPLARLEATPLSLDPAHLAVLCGAHDAAYVRGARPFLTIHFHVRHVGRAAVARAGKLLVPLLDILQSVPILGFISVTVVFFLSLAPGRVLGAELAAIFAIFTSQAWNMAFSFYQSLRTVPAELREAADSFQLSPWMRFWQLEVPFALPGLIWNMMMSMSGGWFFVVASEAISVRQYARRASRRRARTSLLAIERRDLEGDQAGRSARCCVVILLYDQLLFRPLVAWVDGLRFEQDPGGRCAAEFLGAYGHA